MRLGGSVIVCALLRSCYHPLTPNTKGIMVDLPAQLLKTPLRLNIIGLSQLGRFEVGSGKHHKNGPRGRFGLIFGANPI